MKMNAISGLLKKHWKVAAAVAAVVVAWAWFGRGEDKIRPGRVAYEPGIAVPAGAATIKVEASMTAPRIYVVGTVASEEKVNLSARIPAYVNQVLVTAGDRVKKGQTLVTLDDREIREQLAAAEAQLKQAEAEYQRARQLFEKNATTDQALTAAESGFHSARAQVERVKVMLSYAQVTAPMDGIVTERRVESGDLANPGQLLLALYDPSRMRLEAPVPVRLIEKLALNQAVEMDLERPARGFPGKVTEIVSEIDPSSRTQKVKVHIETGDSEVLPGTFGRLWVEDDARAAIRIPASAIYRVGQLELVQVVEGSRAIRRLVRTGPAYGGEVEILSGLAAGDVILAVPVKES
jgi:RND family efflux transporter MFP subunit